MPIARAAATMKIPVPVHEPNAAATCAGERKPGLVDDRHVTTPPATGAALPAATSAGVKAAAPAGMSALKLRMAAVALLPAPTHAL